MNYLYGIAEKKRSAAKKILLVNLCLIVLTAAGLFLYLSHGEKEKEVSPAASVSESREKTQKSKPAAEEEQISSEPVIQSTSLVDITYNYACGHSVEQIKEPPKSIIGKTKEEIEKENKNYLVESISTDVSVISVFYDEECPEHYIIRLEENKLKVYRKSNAETPEREIEIDKTNIYKEDIPILEKGIEVASKEELLEYLEDFSS